MDEATGLLMFCEKIRDAVDAKIALVIERLSALEKKSDQPVLDEQDVVRLAGSMIKTYDAEKTPVLPAVTIGTEVKGEPDAEGLAVHSGGLWRFKINAEGKPDWDCVIDGVKDIVVEHDGERTIKTIVTLASGQTTEKTVTIPAMIYRGVHQEGQAYEKGDTVTRKGSIWCCAAESTDATPDGESADWQLAVKRGRDGKDAS